MKPRMFSKKHDRMILKSIEDARWGSSGFIIMLYLNWNVSGIWTEKIDFCIHRKNYFDMIISQ